MTATATEINPNLPGIEVEGEHQLPIKNVVRYLQKFLNLNQEGPPLIRKFGYGVSNPTYYIEYGGKKMVLRMEPAKKYQIIPFCHGMKHEYSVLGSSFYIMEYVHGRVITPDALAAMTPDERRTHYDALIRMLVQLHSIDVEKYGIISLDEKGHFYKRNIEKYAKLYYDNKTDEIPELELVISWLRENIPNKETTVIVHGDYRLDNAIFHESRPEILALLDWERWGIADRGEELTYTGIIVGFQGSLDGVPTVPEFKHAYYKEAGVQPISDWRFYDAATMFRLAASFQYTKAKKIKENLPDEHPGIFMATMVDSVAKGAWAAATRESP
ncbi:acyl-CoA dehydrogenase family member 10 isoform X2 [Nematostella vectensis]|uniref:acyl-CoA dehydrogenase family member 10 isoform X2 n=1 Tax=Nematostella vectensis TaxID=45351 RepID=UPI0020774A0F|nr:acyl-CoA dehydrogenase family member 10 isoform X2 [Nematostella vectensis]